MREFKTFVSVKRRKSFYFADPIVAVSSQLAKKEETRMKINSKQVQELRTLTGAGVMDCKRTLDETLGDMSKALAMLKEKAAQAAKKKEQNSTRAGYVHSYVHDDGRIGVLIEARCETDFLSKSSDFRTLLKELALQIVSEAPRYVKTNDVPAEILEQVEAEAAAQAADKPASAAPKIIAGKVRKFLSKNCLMEQPFIKNPDVQISNLVQALSAKSGESIQIVQFSRFEIS